MAKRIISGIIGMFMLVWVLVFLPPIATAIAIGIIAAVALYELYNSTGMLDKTKIPIVIVGYAMGEFIMFGTNKTFLPVLCAGIILMFTFAVFNHKEIKFADCAKGFFAALYVFALMMHITLTRMLDGGILLTFGIFIGSFITDTGAYFVGSLFGKNKLNPEISPKKTVEGALGGAIAGNIGFVILGIIGMKGFGYYVNWTNLLIIGTLLAVISQFGDLAASLIKREIGIKDFGNIMPGHGGIMDRFDSVLFVAPVFYYMNMLLPIFVIK
ncbi:MAG: phosphatidate cytidylyltransferase [Bacillota bacterium]|nr:phosphatidate cytidylyltransferase [Bacillota bacterium]